jgi:hypothetical protein
VSRRDGRTRRKSVDLQQLGAVPSQAVEEAAGPRGLARVRENPLAAWLAGFALVAIVGLGIVLATVSAEDREALWVEVGKGLIQIVAVVVLGGALKLVADRYQQRLESAEATSRAMAAKDEKDQTFRQYDALVATTNTLRKVPIFIEANRSVKTWSEQMSDVIAASLALRAIKHEIYSSRGVAGRPFQDTAALVYLFEVMYHYTDWVADDFAANKSDLAQLQANAEVKRNPEAQRAHKTAVWTGTISPGPRTLPRRTRGEGATTPGTGGGRQAARPP